MSNGFPWIAIALLTVSCDRQEQAPPPPTGQSNVTTIAQQKPTYTGTKGGKCKVVDGANKGKSGTYNDDGDCSGDWGTTECTEQDGKDNGKCKDATRTSTFPIGDHLSVATVTLLNDAGEPVHCTIILPDAGAASPHCRPLGLDTIKDLQSSEEENDRRVAEAVSRVVHSPTRN